MGIRERKNSVKGSKEDEGPKEGRATACPKPIGQEDKRKRCKERKHCRFAETPRETRKELGTAANDVLMSGVMYGQARLGVSARAFSVAGVSSAHFARRGRYEYSVDTDTPKEARWRERGKTRRR